jgi:L-lactate dehydrogenase complex protein LldF
MTEILSFRERANRALSDPVLQGALTNATGHFLDGKERVLAELPDLGLPDVETLRRRGRAIRERTIANLDRYLARLADEVQAAGGTVHWAKDAAEACRVVVEIASAHGARRIAKSKSMLSEEIGVNEALHRAGAEVVETDLGEWIIQLAGEPPSHIIAPAVHKTKEQVAGLFSQRLGRPVPPDIPGLNRVARETLREIFLEAEMGISGVNFAVVESGTLVIVTNEGNGRFATGLPPVHVAVMGMEKVVPTWDDLAVLLALLPRFSTGQHITSYVSCITGPRRPAEPDGPDELHLVIVDNGRSELLKGPYLESLYCIRCGACLNACPVYKVVGGHAYGWVYSGPIGAVQGPLLQGMARFHELPHASSLCGACRDACPTMVDLPRMLLELRRDEVEGAESHVPWAERLIFRLFAWAVCHPRLFRLAARLGRRLQGGAGKPTGERWVAAMPFPASRWTDFRDFPQLAAKPFHERWEQQE